MNAEFSCANLLKKNLTRLAHFVSPRHVDFAHLTLGQKSCFRTFWPWPNRWVVPELDSKHHRYLLDACHINDRIQIELIRMNDNPGFFVSFACRALLQCFTALKVSHGGIPFARRRFLRASAHQDLVFQKY